MINTIIASAALFATVAVAQVGSAVVINGCNYAVGMTNVPSSGGGQDQIGPQSLNPGGRYSQEYIELTNGNGWSNKLTVNGQSGVLQFEYTWQNDGIIWYDLSAVNGDPFNGDWYISGSAGCSPNQAAYMYPTDDANGEQSCPQDATVTVTLCGKSGGGASGGGSSGGSPSASPAASPAPSPQPSAGAPSAPSAPAPSAAPAGGHHHGGHGGSGFQQLQGEATTLATVTNIKTKVVTHYVTVSPSPVPQNKRDEQHLHRHMAHHNHF